MIDGLDAFLRCMGTDGAITSTDGADAVVLAWHKREDALRRQMRTRLDPERAWGGFGGGTGWMGS